MTPFRLNAYVVFMCGDNATTPATIKTAVNSVKTDASASKEYDTEFYCTRVISRIDSLTAAVPAWTAQEIKEQLRGQINVLVPGVP
jgi:hypothetical protein